MPFTWVRDADPQLETARAGAAGAVDDERLRRAGAVLPRMYAYLRDNAPDHPSLAPAIEETTAAVAAYQAGLPDDVQAALRRALAAVDVARRADPRIPAP